MICAGITRYCRCLSIIGSRMNEGAPAGKRRPEAEKLLFADHKQMAGVLRVNFPVAAQRCRRVSRAQLQLLEDLLLQGPTLVDREQVTVLAVSVYHSVRVNRRSIDAPLEAIVVVRNAGYRAVRISLAAQRVGVLECQLDGQIWSELCENEIVR